MQPSLRTRIALGIAAVFWSLCVHLINAAYTGRLIHQTADDASYLRPAENFLTFGTWRENFAGPSAFVQRPPLMGAQHAIFYFISPEAAPYLTFALALILHGIAVVMLAGLLCSRFNKRIAGWTIGAYIFLPAFWGFLSYQITEAFSVSFVTIAWCLLLKKNTSIYRWLAICFLAWLFRPVLILLFVPIVIKMLRKQKLLRPSKLQATVLLLLFIVTSGWEIRKHSYMGTWLDPHPIYSEQNETLFRPAHRALSNLFRVWEVRPENFHLLATYASADDAGLLSYETTQEYVRAAKAPVSADELKFVLMDYGMTSRISREQFGKSGGAPETPSERRFIRSCNSITKRLAMENKFQCFVSTPLRSASHVLRKSQLNLEIFQLYWRGNPLAEGLRYACLLLIFSGLAATLFGLFNPELRAAALGIVLYMFYLFWIQRMNEDRYGVVMLPVFLLALAFAADALKSRIRKSRKQ